MIFKAVWAAMRDLLTQ